MATLSSVGLLALCVALLGCEMLQPNAPTKHTQTSYIPVEYRKFVSGVFVDDLKNKYVRVECAFSSTMSGTLPGGYSPSRYMAFDAMAFGAGLEAPETLTVVVPKDLADIVFTLTHADRLRIGGRAVVVTVSTVGGRIFRQLILEATSIEKIQ
ncbi:MAG: hypothetical protein HY735_02820 [Verrucomicrobia bacterium]|nr:hypothetical protein [Verrucomicrobiota bacterium]